MYVLWVYLGHMVLYFVLLDLLNELICVSSVNEIIMKFNWGTCIKIAKMVRKCKNSIWSMGISEKQMKMLWAIEMTSKNDNVNSLEIGQNLL